MILSLPAFSRCTRAAAMAVALLASETVVGQTVAITDYYTYRPLPGDSFTYLTRSTYPDGSRQEGTWTSVVTPQTRRVGNCDYYITRVHAAITQSGSTVESDLEAEVAIDPLCSGGFEAAYPNPCTNEWSAPTDVPRTVTLGTLYAYDDTVTQRCFFQPHVQVSNHIGDMSFSRGAVSVAAGTFQDALTHQGSKIVTIGASTFRVVLAAEWFAPGLPPLYSDESISEGSSPAALRQEIELMAFSRGSAPGPATKAEAVEYHHAAFDHYFITALPDEIDALDTGKLAGWTRTSNRFNVYAMADAPGDTARVCRFFSATFAPRSSHFYTPLAGECSSVMGNQDWMFEGEVFNVALPAPDGSCPAGTVPVYRLYNNGISGAPNHRYTTDLAVRAETMARGWAPEGYGASGVIMCSPA